MQSIYIIIVLVLCECHANIKKRPRTKQNTSQVVTSFLSEEQKPTEISVLRRVLKNIPKSSQFHRVIVRIPTEVRL